MSLAELREKRNLSQAALGRLANVSTSLINRYESGLIVPSLKVKVRLANALGVTVEELCKGNWKIENRRTTPARVKVKPLSKLEKTVQLAKKHGMSYAEMQQKETLGLLKIKGGRLLFKGRDY